jgi:hypothetical protein
VKTLDAKVLARALMILAYAIEKTAFLSVMSQSTNILSSIFRPAALSTKYFNVVISLSASGSLLSLVSCLSLIRTDFSRIGSTNAFSG